MFVEIVCLDAHDEEIRVVWHFYADRLPLWHEVEEHIANQGLIGLMVETYHETACPINYN